MSTGINKLYAERHDDFRRMQDSLSRLSFGDLVIDLGEIANGTVWLDEDCVFYIQKIPSKGDYVLVTHDTTDYDDVNEKGLPKPQRYIDSKMNLSSLSIKILDELLRLMKKAIIISEIRSLT